MPDLTPESIAQAATEPASATDDGQSAQAVPISEQIKAAQFQAAAATTGTNPRGGRKSAFRGTIARAVPPGAT